MIGIRSLIDSLSIRTKIALGAGVIALSCWVLLAGFSYLATGLLLQSASRRMFDVATDNIGAELRATYEPVERVTSVLAYSRFMGAHTEKERLEQVPVMIEFLHRVPAATALQVGDDQGDYFIVRVLDEARGKLFEAPAKAAYMAELIDAKSRINRRWFYDSALQLLGSWEVPETGYDPRTRPWYQKAVAAPAVAIRTPPYIFFFMSEVGVTVARSAADRHSVVAADVTLASVSRALGAKRITPSTQMVVHDAGGVVAWSGSTPVLIDQGGALRRRTVAELGHPALAEIAEGRKPAGWLVDRAKFGFIKESPSELIIAVPESELLEDMQGKRTLMLAISFVVLALMIPLAWVFANRISNPLRELHKAIGRVAGGDFDIWLPNVRTKDEVSDLNIALRTMRTSLKKHIEDLAAAVAARERLAGELEVAKRIQMSFVPGGGEFLKVLPSARLFARVIPARAVGGDLYEMIQFSDGRFFVAIGDVSDKGIPAALLMARVMTILKLLVPSALDLPELAHRLNAQLAVGNDDSMFTTLFGAIIDPSTGNVQYVSAGHNPPAIIRRSGVQLLTIESGAPIGLFEGRKYVEASFRFEAGERLVLYTDGVTEAWDKDRNQFGEDRLVALLERIGFAGSAEDLGNAILHEVSAFAGEAPQSDDITILIVDRT